MKTKLFHGGDKYLTNLDIHSFYGKHTNVAEGIGTYFFTRYSPAQRYGKCVTSIEVESKSFLPSRSFVSDLISTNKILKLLKSIEITNTLFYDYGLEPRDFIKLVEFIKEEEVRNFQIELLQYSNINSFVKGWLTTIESHGTFNDFRKDYTVYAVLKHEGNFKHAN